MSKKDEALELALVAERVLKAWEDPQGMPALCEEMKCLREALAEPVEWLTGCPECGMDGGCDCDSGTWNPPAQQEPVAHCEAGPECCPVCHKELNPEPAIYPDEAYEMGLEEVAFYTSPLASKPWVGLTDEERNAIGRHHAYVDNIIRATEAKLKEKNT